MGSQSSRIRNLLLAISVVFSVGLHAASEDGKKAPEAGQTEPREGCAPLEGAVQPPAIASKSTTSDDAKARPARRQTAAPRAATAKESAPAAQTAIRTPSARATRRNFTLEDFLNPNDAENLAILHPFTVANAAEKQYALMTHVPAREAVDPLFRVKKVTIHPMLAGEHPASGGRMVVGQEDSLHTFVQFLGSIARGDRTGKAIGFPGPPGTGKTETLYVADRIETNLSVEDKYKQYSYRFKNLHTIPFLRPMFRFDRDGNPNQNYLDPDMARSPFTLLRADMQDRVLKDVVPKIRKKWNMTITKGWILPEPKTEAILQAIFEHEFPDIAEGRMDVMDLAEDEYLGILRKYVVIVPKSLVQKRAEEAGIIRAQTDNPNWQALFAAPNMSRAAYYTQNHPLAIDYTGQVFKTDGGLLMFDEMYRNPPELLNTALEIVQNQVVQTDFGKPVKLDIVPVWNANDESIEKAREDQALKASLDRTEQNPMRLLLPPNQIEAVSLFQVDVKRFKMRLLDANEILPVDFPVVYPAPDSQGKTYSAYGRYALYYDAGDFDILISPLTLNYMSWLAAATRFNVEPARLMEFKDELNLITANPALFTDPLTRLRIALGERSVELPEKMELSRVVDLLKEGDTGISSRDVETWFKKALNNAVEERKRVLTPRMMDIAFAQLLDRGTIKPPKKETRAAWQLIRARVKHEMILPKLDQDVKSIISGDGQKAERIYDEIEREFIEIASNPGAKHVLPDDGSQGMPINRERLEEVKKIYREKFGREFSPSFLLRHLRGARRGQGERDGQLLDAVRDMVAKHDALTADYVSAFDSLYKGENNDPAIIEKEGQVGARLHQYGYDRDSFREAVAFVAQLRSEKQMAENDKRE